MRLGIFALQSHCAFHAESHPHVAVEKIVHVEKIVEVAVEKIKPVEVIKHVEVPGPASTVLRVSLRA